MGWWADFKRVWNTPIGPQSIYHDQEHCDCCVWFSELGFGVNKEELAKQEREWGAAVNASLKVWDQLPDGQRTADTFQQELQRRRGR